MATKVREVLGEQGGLVGLCLGSSPAKEKGDPHNTALNVLQLWEQFQEDDIPCFILSLVPVLAEEARGDPFSSCWSSQVLLGILLLGIQYFFLLFPGLILLGILLLDYFHLCLLLLGLLHLDFPLLATCSSSPWYLTPQPPAP